MNACYRIFKKRFAVVIAMGIHPFPFRTRKLSPLAPMVLRGQPLGRVGHCRLLRESPEKSGFFHCFVNVKFRFGDLLHGIIEPGGIPGKQRLKKRPVFFPLFAYFPLNTPSTKPGESRTLPIFIEKPLGN